MERLRTFRQPLIRLLAGLILLSSLGAAVSHAAAGGNADTVLPHYDPLLFATTATPIPRSTLARLRPSDQQALARGEAVTVLVEFEQSAAQALAAQGATGAGTTVAVLDTGVDRAFPGATPATGVVPG